MLFTSAVAAAFNTNSRNKVAALAKVLKSNLADDQKIDRGLVIVAALNAFEAPRLRVLHALAHDLPVRPVPREFAEGA